MDVGVGAKGIVFEKSVFFLEDSLAPFHPEGHLVVGVINGKDSGISEFVTPQDFTLFVKGIFVGNRNFGISVALGFSGQAEPDGKDA